MAKKQKRAISKMGNSNSLEDLGSACPMTDTQEDKEIQDAADPSPSAFMEDGVQVVEPASPRSFYTDSSRLRAVDTPQASQDDETQQCQDIAVDQFTYFAGCEYSTPIVQVYVGPTPALFLVHRGILHKSSVLSQNLEWLEKYDALGLQLPEADPEHFEMVARYLYTGTYQYTGKVKASKDGHEADHSADFRSHAEIYCLARKYGLDDLTLLASGKMSIDNKMDFRSLVEIARLIYPKLDDDEIWFSTYFKTKASRAVIENPLLAEEHWILDIYKNGGGRLAVDLFKTFVTSLKDKEFLTGGSINEPEASRPVIDPATSNCKDREAHLKSLRKKGPWENCQKCTSERDRIIDNAHAVISVTINDLLPAIYPGIDLQPEDDQAAKKIAEAKKKELRSAMRDVTRNLYTTPIASDILQINNDESSGHCPDQAEHLKRKEGKWGWENCSWCLKDRAQVLEKLQESESGKHLNCLAKLKAEWERQNTFLAGPHIGNHAVPGETLNPLLFHTPMSDKPKRDPVISIHEMVDFIVGNKNIPSPTVDAPDCPAEQPKTLPTDDVLNPKYLVEPSPLSPINAIEFESQPGAEKNRGSGEPSQKANKTWGPWDLPSNNGDVAKKEGKNKKGKAVKKDGAAKKGEAIKKGEKVKKPESEDFSNGWGAYKKGRKMKKAKAEEPSDNWGEIEKGGMKKAESEVFNNGWGAYKNGWKVKEAEVEEPCDIWGEIEKDEIKKAESEELSDNWGAIQKGGGLKKNKSGEFNDVWAAFQTGGKVKKPELEEFNDGWSTIKKGGKVKKAELEESNDGWGAIQKGKKADKADPYNGWGDQHEVNQHFLNLLAASSKKKEKQTKWRRKTDPETLPPVDEPIPTSPSPSKKANKKNLSKKWRAPYVTDEAAEAVPPADPDYFIFQSTPSHVQNEKWDYGSADWFT